MEKEFDELDSRLRIILFALEGYLKHKYNTSLIITHLWRSQKEQDEIYKNDPEYQKRPFKSVHQYYRGADISISTVSGKKIANWLNVNFFYAPGKPTALVHTVASWGIHLHIQVSYHRITEIMKIK